MKLALPDRRICLGLLCGLLAVACRPGGLDSTSDTETQAAIHPKPGPGILISDRNSANNSGGDAAQAGLLIIPPAGYRPQNSYNIDLDLDGKVDQVIIVRKPGGADDPLSILFVTLNQTSGHYAISWEGRTNAVDPQTLVFSQVDILGSHKPAIVFRGTTANNKQSLAVFQPFVEGGKLLARPVALLEADTSIDIDTTNRGAAYTEGQDAALPFSINALNKENQNSGSLDMVRSVWTWDAKAAIYRLSRTEAVAGAKIQEGRLDRLFRGSQTDFEAFIAGAWTRTVDVGTEKNPRLETQLIFFDQDARLIQLIEGDRLESNEWITSTKQPLSSFLQIFMVNESFRSMRSAVSANVKDGSSLTITIQERKEWSGEYQRVDLDKDPGARQNAHQVPPLHVLALSGLFKGEHDEEILFSGQSFTYRAPGREQGGSYVSFGLSDPILTLAYLNDQGIVLRTEHFIAKLSEQKDNGTLIRSLDLRRADLTVNGPRPRGNELKHFVQSIK